MSVSARTYPIFRTERTLVLAIAAFALVPVLYVLGRALLVSRNVAYWDELDTALLLLLRLDQATTVSQVLAHLFALGNEHRTFTSRLLFATSYWTTGTVNFVVIGAIGNLFICALCGLLVYTAGSTARRVFLGVLLAFLLFQLEHYENFQWSGASIDHFQVVLLAGASVIGLARGTRGGWLAAMLFALLATFTLAHGLVAWGIGALVLAGERRWPRLIGWLGAGAFAAAIFFVGFNFNPGHNIGTATGAGLVAILHYWLILLGAPLAFGQAAVAPYLGAILLALLAWTLHRGAFSRERIAIPLALWAIGALGLISVGRAALTHGHVYSRYYVLGALAWALVLFVLGSAPGDALRPYRVLLRALPALILFNVAANFAFLHDARSWVICRDNAAEYYQRHGRDGLGRFTLHPDPAYATNLIREVERAGLYQMPLACQPRKFPKAQATADLTYFIDRINVDEQMISIEGWVARAGRPSAPDQIHLVLQSDHSRHIFTTINQLRNDVTAAHPQETWLQSGFRFQRRRWLLPAENFQIGLLIYSQGRAEFVMTAHRLDMTGKGVGLLAGSE
jgi:hypothetical protein